MLKLHVLELAASKYRDPGTLVLLQVASRSPLISNLVLDEIEKLDLYFYTR